MIESSTVVLPPAVQPARVLVWFLHLALPVLGLWLLLARPTADLTWENHAGHFWLVVVGCGHVVLGLRMGTAPPAHGRRLFWCWPLQRRVPARARWPRRAAPQRRFRRGLAGRLLAVFAVVSCLSFRATRGVPGLVVVWRRACRWAVERSDLPPLNQPPPARDVEGPLTTVAIVAVVLYVAAAVRYYLLHRRAPAAVLLSLVTAFALLAEAMVAVTMANKWHLSWWEWHVLLTFAFGFVAYSAYVQYRREGTSAGLFDAIGLSATRRQVRAEYGAALEELRRAAGTGEHRPRGPPLAPRLAERFGRPRARPRS